MMIKLISDMSAQQKKAKPRRFVRMFMPRFADDVRSRRKRRTMRPTPKRMPRPGDIIDCRMWVGRPYGNGSRQETLCEGLITKVQRVELYRHGVYYEPVETHDGGQMLLSNGAERDAFAVADGFADWRDLVRWFEQQHGLPFQGILIEWTFWGEGGADE